MLPLPSAVLITNVGNNNNIFLWVSLGKTFGSSSFENILIVRVSAMAVRTHDGKKVKKVWEKRRLQCLKSPGRRRETGRLSQQLPGARRQFLLAMWLNLAIFACNVA